MLSQTKIYLILIYSALSDKDNAQRVNLFFTLLSQLLLTSQSASTISTFYIRSDVERSYDTLSLSPVCIQLPEEAKMNVDNVLSEFEAADFGDMVSICYFGDMVSICFPL